MKRIVFIDTTLVVGISVSIVIALIFALLGASGFESVLAGMLGTLFSLQVDTIGRMEQRLKKNADQLMIHKDLELLQPWLIDSLHASLASAADLATEGIPLLENQVRREFCRLRNRLSELKSGILRTPFDDVGLLISAAADSKKTIRATSLLGIDKEWWSSPAGRKYWNANLDALERGVTVSRVFIHDDFSKVTKFAHRQAEAGIIVYEVLVKELPSQLRMDMIIFDEDLSYRAEVSDDGTPVGNEICVFPKRLEEQINLFKDIILQSRLVSTKPKLDNADS